MGWHLDTNRPHVGPTELPSHCCGLSHRCTHAENWLLGVQGSRRWHPPSSHGTELGGSGGPHCPPCTPPSTGQQTQEATSSPGGSEIGRSGSRQQQGGCRVRFGKTDPRMVQGMGRKRPRSGVTPAFAHGGQCMDKLSWGWVFPFLWTGKKSPST